MTANDSQTKAKETLLHIFDHLSTAHKAEVLEFALFMREREGQPSVDLSSEVEHLLSRLKPEASQSLQGSVLHNDEPFEPVAATHWDALQ